MFLPHPRVKVSIVGSLRDREVACSASDRQGSNFESCVWRTVSSQSSHNPQEVLLAQFSLYVHKGGLKPDSFHLDQRFCLQRPAFAWEMWATDRVVLLLGDRSRPLVTVCDRLRRLATRCDRFRPFAIVCDCLRPFATVCDHLRSFATVFARLRRLRSFATICDWFATICDSLRLCTSN